MDLNELAALVGETPRQIRYLIAEDFVPNAQGPRVKPDYGAEHVEAVQRYQQLRKQNLKPSQIKAMLQVGRLASEGGKFKLAPGVAILIDPAGLDPGTSSKEVGELVAAILNSFQVKLTTQENKDAP